MAEWNPKLNVKSYNIHLFNLTQSKNYLKILIHNNEYVSVLLLVKEMLLTLC